MKEAEVVTTNNAVESEEMNESYLAALAGERETMSAENAEELEANALLGKCGPGEVFNPRTQKCEAA